MVRADDGGPKPKAPRRLIPGVAFGCCGLVLSSGSICSSIVLGNFVYEAVRQSPLKNCGDPPKSTGVDRYQKPGSGLIGKEGYISQLWRAQRLLPSVSRRMVWDLCRFVAFSIWVATPHALSRETEACVENVLRDVATDLYRRYPELAQDPAVIHEHQRQQRQYEARQRDAVESQSPTGGAQERARPPSRQPQDQIAAWLRAVERTHTHARGNEASLQRLREYYHRRYVIREDQVPESYFEHQRRIAREQGHGDVQMTAEQRLVVARHVVQVQRDSLNAWIDYFLSSDTDHYPFALKIWAFNEMVRLAPFDPGRGEFRRRSGSTTAAFPEISREALAQVMDQRLQNPRSSESFAKLYGRAVAKIREQRLAQAEAASRTQGRWVLYPQGSDPGPLVRSLEGHATDWCTASAQTAASQLEAGAFHVYYTQDAQGNPTIPRIAIRMEENRIAEVRGVAANQNLDGQIAGTTILRDKLQTFGDEGHRYEQASENMARLTQIEARAGRGETLSSEDLRFLYEVDGAIEGFGYKKDPRVQELRSRRNLRQDVAAMAGVREVAQISALKNGTPAERVRYILGMGALEATGLAGEMDPEFATTLGQWLRDPHQDLSVRRQIAVEHFTARSIERRPSVLASKSLSELLTHFSPAEQQSLVQGLLINTRHRRLVLQNKDHLLALMVLMRRNPEARSILVGAYEPRFQSQIAHILDDASLSNDVATRLIPGVAEGLNGHRLRSVEAALNLAHREAPSLAPWLIRELHRSYIDNQPHPQEFARDMIRGLVSSDEAVRRFSEGVVDAASPELYPALRDPSSILRSLRRLHEGAGTLESRVGRWLADEHVTSAFKADFLIAHFGNPDGIFFHHEQSIPIEQRGAVWAQMERRSNIATFLRLARQRQLPQSVFNGVAVEAYLFANTIFPQGRGRTFTMGEGAEAHDVTLSQDTQVQMAPVTQLQMFLATGRNGSSFTAPDSDGDHRVINGVALNVDHPAEQVSWHDAQAYAAAVGGHMPTEAQWEAAARAGTTTPYSFGGDEGQLSQYGWNAGNSGDSNHPHGRTHAVARLRANPAGMYDVHGNVWEWCQDRHGPYPQGVVTDPTGPPSGSYRVLRGGSWFYDARNLRSALRYDYPPDNRGSYIGFRLARTQPHP